MNVFRFNHTILRAPDETGGAAEVTPVPATGEGDSLLTTPPAAGADTLPAAAGADTTPAAAPVEPMKPEDYEFDLPEGITPDEGMIGAYREAAAAQGVSKEVAQALLAAVAPQIAERLAAPANLWAEKQAEWSKAVQAHPELGGDKLDGVKATFTAAVNSVLNEAEGAALRQALFETGAGNHPGIILAFARMASQLVEKPPVVGNPPAAAAKSIAAQLYPTANSGG
mgnify:CR=1 FL=1